jgi:hypothetical protein
MTGVIHEHAFEDLVLIVRLARNELVVPHDLSAVGIQRERAVRV